MFLKEIFYLLLIIRKLFRANLTEVLEEENIIRLNIQYNRAERVIVNLHIHSYHNLVIGIRTINGKGEKAENIPKCAFIRGQHFNSQ